MGSLAESLRNFVPMDTRVFTSTLFGNRNPITEKDFSGWVQEQGLYYPNKWSSEFIPILASNDEGESSKTGGLVIAKFGKGNYIYTGLSFFRELPEGVSGAYRLLANMIALD
jgi:hypothetical protein